MPQVQAMKKLLTFLSIGLASLTLLADTTNYASLSWTVYGKQIYRVDTKTNLTDAWYPHSIVAMWGNYLGTNAYGSNLYSTVTSDMYQTVTIQIPVSTQSGFFRLYTCPENTNGVIWPTASSTNVPFTLTLSQLNN